MGGEVTDVAILRLGQVVITRGASSTIDSADSSTALEHHTRGDWGDVGAQDWEANDAALAQGERILSSYRDRNGVKFWIITEGDRSVTTVLLPDDY
jgi:hypothetical protein